MENLTTEDVIILLDALNDYLVDVSYNDIAAQVGGPTITSAEDGIDETQNRSDLRIRAVARTYRAERSARWEAIYPLAEKLLRIERSLMGGAVRDEPVIDRPELALLIDILGPWSRNIDSTEIGARVGIPPITASGPQEYQDAANLYVKRLSAMHQEEKAEKFRAAVLVAAKLARMRNISDNRLSAFIGGGEVVGQDE